MQVSLVTRYARQCTLYADKCVLEEKTRQECHFNTRQRIQQNGSYQDHVPPGDLLCSPTGPRQTINVVLWLGHR
jgi:hypothetical protein